LIIIAISELSIYGVLYSGWAANSKYPLLGSMRSAAQMISYSVNLSLIILAVIFVHGSIYREGEASDNGSKILRATISFHFCLEVYLTPSQPLNL
jgi:NADH:ubiquinone oxidoreductase subunit H